MKQKINLSISTPCSENFNDFKQTTIGGFCSSCKKEVIDFRKMSDEKLMAYFKNKEGNTCGYFNSDQLKDYSLSIESQSANKFKYLRIFSLAFFSMISLHNIQAQQNTSNIEIIQTSKVEKKNVIEKEIRQDGLLSGVISDESGPLPGANIVLKGTLIGTTTNFDGEFKFPKALKEGDILVVSYIGFQTKNIKIKENQTILNVLMPMDSCVLMGEVDVNAVYKSKRTFWQKVKGIF